MGSPDNRRKADDSCQAPCVGGSMSGFFHDRDWYEGLHLPVGGAGAWMSDRRLLGWT
jgi:hypothetical protein